MKIMSFTHKFILATASLLAAISLESLTAATIYIATTGSDSAGTGQATAPFATIQKGVSHAQEGDTVLVAAGTYTGEGNRNIDLLGKAVTVKSVAGPKSVTLDLQQNRAFLASSSESLATVIDGFTIVGGYAVTGQDWGGIGIVSINGSASLTIKNCIFTNNKVEISYFTARANIIEDNSNSGSVIENCLLYGNTCLGGYWMTTSFSNVIFGRFTKAGFVTVTNNYLESNSWGNWSLGGLAVSIWEGGGSLHSSIVRENGNKNIYCAYSPTTPSYNITDGTIIDPTSESLTYTKGYTQSDPLFANPQAGDFSLSPGSPAIDAGDPSVVDPDGTRSDIGFNLARAIESSNSNNDSDSDGLVDSVETNTDVFVSESNAGTNPNNADTDADGVPDGLEVKEKTSPVDATKFNSFSKGMVAYYRFNENFNDESGFQNDLSNMTSGVQISGDRFGNMVGSVKLTSNEDYAFSVKKSGISGNQNHSISLWVYFAEAPVWDGRYEGSLVRLGSAVGVVEGSEIGRESRIMVDNYNEPGQSRLLAHGGYSDLEKKGLGDIFLGQWRHIVFSYNGQISTSSLYLDGVKLDASLWMGLNNIRNIVDGPVYLGSTPLVDGRASGSVCQLSDIRIYNRALSAEEVASLYTAESTPKSSFQIIEGSFSWHEAKADAKARGGRLAVLDTQEKIDEVDALIRSRGTWPEVWIGLTDEEQEGNWKWITGAAVSNAPWSPSEPNGSGNYGLIYGSGHAVSGLWDDQPDSLSKAYIIEYIYPNEPSDIDTDGDGLVDSVETNTGVFTSLSDTGTNPNQADTDGDGLSDGWEVGYGRYKVIDNAYTWEQAKADAEARGGHLATITSESEWNFVTSNVEKLVVPYLGGPWLGGFQLPGSFEPDGDWKWVTGEFWNFAAWNVGPDNDRGIQDCIRLFAPEWDDMEGTWLNAAGYLLEYGYPTDPTKADTDGDGYNDKVESDAGTDPNSSDGDADGDGYADAEEIQWSTDPNDSSSYPQVYLSFSINGGGYIEASGISMDDPWSGGSYSGYVPLRSTVTLTALDDYDYWFISWSGDASEYSSTLILHMDSNKSVQANFQYVGGGGYWPPYDYDSDGDGIYDDNEYSYGTDPYDYDTDNDGLGDGAEVYTYYTNPLLVDSDGDGLTDGNEVYQHATNPLLVDTDADGYSDGNEVQSGSNPNDPGSVPNPNSGPLFTDIATESPSLAKHSIIAVMDYDRDGKEDLLVQSDSGSRLLRQAGSFQFDDVTSASGLDGLQNALVADFTNDGLEDILDIASDKSYASIRVNNGEGYYAKTDLNQVLEGDLASYRDLMTGDIDNDGDIDLIYAVNPPFGGGAVAYLPNITERGAQNVQFGQKSYLVRTSWQFAKFDLTDANNDGLTDLVILQTNGSWPYDTHPDHPAVLYLGTGRSQNDYLNPDGSSSYVGFVEKADCGINAANEMSRFTSWDIDNDGDLDLINGSSDWRSVSNPHIYINDGAGNYAQQDSPVYHSGQYYHHGITIFDADADNDLDAVWTGLHNFSNIYPRMWKNEGGLAFSDATAEWGITSQIPGSGNLGSSGYAADLDGDGDQDFVVQGGNGWGSESYYAVYRNNADQKGYNCLKVELEGISSHAKGFGARVEVRANGKTLSQWVSNHVGSVPTSRLHFGLGESHDVEFINVYWPSGLKSSLSNPDIVGNTLKITEPASEPTPRFQIVEGSYTWHEAKADAEARGGRLAVLDTQEKIDEANAFLQSQGSWQNLWIGLTDEATEGLWMWIDGSPLSVHNWYPGEPNNTYGIEHYGHIWASSTPGSHFWNDHPGYNMSYLLELSDMGYADTDDSDTEAPQLVSLEILPAQINTSASSATVMVTARITDNLSGNAGEGYSSSPSQIRFKSPSGNQSADAILAYQRISGTAQDGIYRYEMTIPKYAEAGTWTVDSVLLADQVGNYKWESNSDLTARLLPTSFVVTGISDTEAPQLVSLEISPAQINTSASSATVMVTARITDNLSGNAGEGYSSSPSQIRFKSPSGNQSADAILAYQRISGTAQDGFYRYEMTIPKYAEAGIWTVDSVLLADQVGNYKWESNSDLTARLLPTSFVVSGIFDTDNDGLGDSAEVHTYYTNPTNSDSDADGLTDGDEVHQFETNPLNSDTDGDGYSDGEEVERGSNPNDSWSKPMGSISGVVTDETGAALEGVSVTAYQYYQYEDYSGQWYSTSGATDKNGSYQLHGLNPGEYRIQFTDYSGAYLSECYDNAPDIDSAKDVAISGTENVTGINASLGKASSISGTVTDENGLALEGIQVSVRIETEDGSWSSWGVTTDEHGHYTVSGLRAGTYQIEFNDYSGQYLNEYYENATDIDSAKDVTISGSENVTGINASLGKASSISGSVTDENGLALEGIQVSVRMETEDGDWWDWVNFAYTDENGNYTVSGLRSGTYRIQFADWERGDYATEYYNDAQTIETAQDIVVSQSEEVTSIDASLGKASRITGVVTGPDGVTPLAGIYVTVFEDEWWESAGWATTDENGEYSIGGLPEGTYRVRFDDSKGVYAIKFYGGSSAINSAAEIILPKSSTRGGIDVSLTKSAIISGEVTDANGLPLEGISVSIHQYDANDEWWHWVANADTDSNGEYSLSGFGAGAYRIEFRDQYGEYAFEANGDAANIEMAKDIRVAESQILTGIDAALSKASSISGKVTGLDGVALTDVEIDLERLGNDGEWHWHAYAETDKYGEYDISGLSAGVYRIEFEDESGQHALEYYNNAVEFELATNINLGAEKNLTIDASMVLGSRISGKVTGPDGSSISNVSVDTFRMSSKGKWEWYEDTEANADGTYEIGGLPNGTYRVGFLDDNNSYSVQFHGNNGPTMYFELAKEFVINSSQTLTGVNGKFKEKAATISGKVTDADGVALHDVRVEAYRKDDQGTWRLVLFGDIEADEDEDGFFDPNMLPAGTYRFKFQKEGYITKYYGDSTTLADAKDIVVGEGQTAQGIDVLLFKQPLPQTIGSFANIGSKTFGDAPFAVTAPSASSSLPVTLSVKSGPATISGNTVTLTGAGTVVLAANQAGNANYNAASEVTMSFTVSKGAQSIGDFASIGNKTYGDAPFAVTAPTASSGLPVILSIKSGPATISGNTVTITGAGAVVLAANQAGNANYNAASDVTMSFTVSKAAHAIAAFSSIENKTYGDAPFAITAPTSSIGLPVVLSVKSGPATISGNTVTITGAGTVALAANQVGDANYAAATPVTTSFTVAKATQTIESFASIGNKTLGDAPFAVTPPTASSGLPVTLSVKSGPATISGNTVTINATGIVMLAANQSGNANYLAADPVIAAFAVMDIKSMAGDFVGNYDFDGAAELQDAYDHNGQLSLKVTKGGAFSGSLVVRGSRVGIRGQFDENGFTELDIKTKTLSGISLELLIEPMSDKEYQVAATIAWPDQPNTPFNCYPVAYAGTGGEKNFPLGGRQINSLMASQSTSGIDFGHGFAMIKTSNDGTLKFTGRAADGSTITGTTRLVKDAFGDILAPVSLPLSAVKGLLHGVAEIYSNPEEGQYHLSSPSEWIWVRLPQAKAKTYKAGFAEKLGVYGQVWSFTKGQSALPEAKDGFTFQVDPDSVLLEEPLELSGTWPASNKPTWIGAPKGFTFKVNTATGQISGAAPRTVNGKAAKALSYQGLLVKPALDSYDGAPLFGGGYLLGTESSGVVELTTP